MHWLEIDNTPWLVEKITIQWIPKPDIIKDMRKYPSMLARLPLFLPKKKRETLKEPLILKCGKYGTVAFMKQTLITADESLFMEIIENSTLINDRYQYQLNLKQLCKTLKRGILDIGDSLNALEQTTVKIIVPYEKVDYAGTLITVTKIDGIVTVTFPAVFMVKGEKKTLRQTTLIDRTIYNQLSLFGKALYMNLLSNTGTAYYTDTIKECTNPQRDYPQFIQDVKEQMEKMKTLKVIKSFTYNKRIKKLSYIR